MRERERERERGQGKRPKREAKRERERDSETLNKRRRKEEEGGIRSGAAPLSAAPALCFTGGATTTNAETSVSRSEAALRGRSSASRSLSSLLFSSPSLPCLGGVDRQRVDRSCLRGTVPLTSTGGGLC